jgi:hypothetical protein
MIRVRYTRSHEKDSTEVWLDGSVAAALAEPYAAIDEGQGGITRSDIKDEDIKTLDTFEPGAEVFVESEDPEDILDDTDRESEVATRIYWRAVIGE